MTRGYDAGARRWVDIDDQGGVHRMRRKVCAVDRVELVDQAGWLYCPVCGRTADEMAQEVTR